MEELSEEVDVSVSTVRRDLAVLEAKGILRRTHGGARLITPRSDEFTFTARDTHQLEEKEAIGRACAELIRPNQSVIIDAGTTVYHVARYLQETSRRKSSPTPCRWRNSCRVRPGWNWSSAAA